MIGRWKIAAVAGAALALPVALLANTAAPQGADDAKSAALFVEMGRVIQSPRCINCHPRTDRPLQGDLMQPHNPPVVRGPASKGAPGLECATCHGPANVNFANGEGNIPGHPLWHLAPASMAWEGDRKSVV